MPRLTESSRSGRSNFHCSSFQQVVVSFLSQPGLPFAGILSAERIERIFARHGNLFGVGQIDSTAVMAWSFLGQVLRDGMNASPRTSNRLLAKSCRNFQRPAEQRFRRPSRDESSLGTQAAGPSECASVRNSRRPVC